MGSLTAHHACNLEIGGGLQGLYTIMTNVAVTYNGCSNLLHIVLFV